MRKVIFLEIFLFFLKAVSGKLCPEDAWGELKNVTYEPVGIVEQLDDYDLEVYLVGNSSKCVIWNYDWFGFDSGRTRQMCDFIAAHGYMVIMPDYYRGFAANTLQNPKEFLKNNSDWNGQLKEDFLKVKEYGKNLNPNCETFGSIGTCWGTYPVIRMSEDVEIKAGISMHPSHPPIIENILEENEEEILKEVKSPQMFLPARSDKDSVKMNGLGKKILGDGVEIIEFPDMSHGWTTRGDLSDPKVERDVKKAFNFVISFFGKYL